MGADHEIWVFTKVTQCQTTSVTRSTKITKGLQSYLKPSATWVTSTLSACTRANQTHGTSCARCKDLAQIPRNWTTGPRSSSLASFECGKYSSRRRLEHPDCISNQNCSCIESFKLDRYFFSYFSVSGWFHDCLRWVHAYTTPNEVGQPRRSAVTADPFSLWLASSFNKNLINPDFSFSYSLKCACVATTTFSEQYSF